MSDADITYTDQQWITDMGGRYYIAPISPLFFTVSGPQCLRSQSL